jgi:hypothetical protein
MEYINIARNINEGRGLTQSIKFHLYDPSPVATSALRSRPPLTSLVYAFLLGIRNDPYFLQIFNLGLGIINALLIFCITKNLAVSLLAVTNPNILITGRMVLSDQLFATITLIVTLIYFRTKESINKYILLGFSLGLLTLTRLEGLWFLPIFILAFRKKIRLAIVFAAMFLLTMLPFFWKNYLDNGSPLFTKNDIHYRLLDVREGLEAGFEKNLPTSLEFISANWTKIAPKIIEANTRHFISLAELGYFGPLIIFVALAVWQQRKRFWPMLLFSLGVMFLYGSLWSATFERSRHFIFVYLLLLIPLAEFLAKHRRLPVILLLTATLIGYLFLDVRRILWSRNVDPTVSVWDQSNKREIYDWINSNTRPESIIASTNPFMVNLQTRRPSVAIPINLNAENLPRYLDKFSVKYILVINEDRLDSLFNQFPVTANLSSGQIYFPVDVSP